MARTKKTTDQDFDAGATLTQNTDPKHCAVCGAVFGSCDHTMEKPAQLPATVAAQQVAETLQQRQRDYPPALAARRVQLMRAIMPINKADTNTFHKYHYASANDVCDGVRSLMLDQGLFLDQEETGKKSMNDGVLTIEYAFTWSDMDGNRGPAMLWSGMCRLVDQKGVADDKAAPKAHTQARKYFLIKNLDISTPDMPDSDADKVPDNVKGTTRTPAEEVPAEPHSIVAGNAKEWQRLYLVAIRRAKTLEEVNAWIAVNAPKFESLKAKAPELATAASESVLKRYQELAAQPAPVQEGQNRKPLPPRADGKPNPTQGQGTALSSAQTADASTTISASTATAAAVARGSDGQYGPMEEETFLEGWGLMLANASTVDAVNKLRVEKLAKIEAKLSGMGSSKAIYAMQMRLKQIQAGAVSEDGEWDFESWFRTDFLGALSSCEEGDIERLDQVQQKVVLPARARMTDAQWKQTARKFREEAARIKGDEL